jgi:hypothetical protein
MKYINLFYQFCVFNKSEPQFIYNGGVEIIKGSDVFCGVGSCEFTIIEYCDNFFI